MKTNTKLFLIFLGFFYLNPCLAQTETNPNYAYFKPIDFESVSRDFCNFRFKDIAEDTVVVTMLGKKSKSRELSNEDLKKWFYKNYYDSKLKLVLSSVVNDGYVIVIGQYSKETEIPVRFFTLFLNHMSRKVSIIEIEENK